MERGWGQIVWIAIFALYVPVIVMLGSCIRDSDHAIVNAHAQQDSTNAVFSYSSSAGIVIVKGDTVIVSGDFSVSYNGREIPK